MALSVLNRDKLFRALSFRDASIQDLARASDVSDKTIYRAFGRGVSPRTLQRLINVLPETAMCIEPIAVER
jgi:DNA-binding phage protein